MNDWIKLCGRYIHSHSPILPMYISKCLCTTNFNTYLRSCFNRNRWTVSIKQRKKKLIIEKLRSFNIPGWPLKNKILIYLIFSREISKLISFFTVRYASIFSSKFLKFSSIPGVPKRSTLL